MTEDTAPKYVIPRPPDVYNVLSLGQWLDACAKRNIPAIPAFKIGACWVGELMLAGNCESGPIENLIHLLSHVNRLDLGTDMLRWDCCAGEPIKYHMGKTGTCPSHYRQRVSPDDMRLQFILEDWRSYLPIALWRRPWIEAKRHGGWPVEFRVFADDGQIKGVSNYYPQVSLPDEYMPIAERAINQTVPLADATGGKPFTADWLLTPDEQLLYLEGGPGHTPTGGAHPCCFAPNQVSGIALSPQEGALVH